MRPKFRAWDKHGKKMFANDELIIWNGNVYANDSKKLTCNNLKGWSIDEEYLMQSTGLLDKNGKEIFEGDIISDGHTSRDIRHHQTLGFYTIDDNGVEGFFGDTASLEDFEEVSKYMSENIEIIGNIYENPELLEEKDEKRK